MSYQDILEIKVRTKNLDRRKKFNYILFMFTSATVILLVTRKAAWHATAVAGGGFY